MSAHDGNAERTLGIVPALQAATHRLLETLSDRLQGLGLSPGEVNLLAQFGESDRTLTVAQLVKGTGQRPSTLTGILDRLEHRGLLGRSINDRDRRSFIVSLTDHGMRAASEVGAAFAAVEREIAAGTSEPGRLGFYEVVTAIVHLGHH